MEKKTVFLYESCYLGDCERGVRGAHYVCPEVIRAVWGGIFAMWNLCLFRAAVGLSILSRPG